MPTPNAKQLVSIRAARPSASVAGTIEWTHHRQLRRRALIWGCIAGSSLVVVYLGVLARANSLEHAATEFLRLRHWMTSLVLGFSLQVGLFAYARGASRGHAIRSGGVMASGGTSTVSMVACCAHHLTDVLPLIGLTGTALVLGAYQTLFLLLGVLSNAVGLVYLLSILRRHALFPLQRSALSRLVSWPVDRAVVPVAVASAVVFIAAIIVTFA